MDLEQHLKQWEQLDYILPEDIPKIELYMDQVTTFLDEQLKNTKRYDEDKIFTKTMINNYSKNHLLPPSDKKKYSKNHMILLIFIYYLKSFMSIADIKTLLAPITDDFYDGNGEVTFEEIYERFFGQEKEYRANIKASILDAYQQAKQSFPEVTAKKEQENLQQLSFAAYLGYDIYLRKQVLSQMLDTLYEKPEEKKEKKPKKKK